jgi:acyl-CoA dehydrogenase
VSSEQIDRVIDECLQLFGGYGLMDEHRIVRFCTETLVQRIYAGTSET